ncbi:Glycosyltransferase [Ignavibacterium album JCM 16511]|uniref:Glycosyltransferase n=1 Tax=Ignavibacterium album (strain DSM 19864 / JCM 16511 / NBRC 101810 / Mat9-16) TaxID=945713 RepID=I0AMR7_IGNAJ|nr:TPR domain-containing glycosyltransferase [Ignavibacterium album]AFH50274.1 Glycosyltransferase [Ignavibacterium album JCM 16511]
MNSGISLSMIVKNEGKHLADCLNSVKDVVDEIVIVDTGSTDNTLEIAKSFDAKIFHFEWNDDFSAARNFSLSKCTGNWILYLDADERLDLNSAKKIKPLTEQNDNVGYYCTITSYNSEIQRSNSIRYIRFFRNHPDAKFSGRVHEQITPSLEKLNYRFIHSDLIIHHIGYDISEEGKKQKALRNLKLLEKDLKTNPNDYVLFQIGQSNFLLENFSEAENYFFQLVKSFKLNNQFKAESYSYLAQISFNKFETEEAEKFISSAIRLNDSQPFYHLLLSKIHLRNNKIKEAINELKKSIECAKNSAKSSITNLQQVNVSLQEILFYGLQLSYQTNDSLLKQKMIEELYKLNEEKFIKLINHIESGSAINLSDVRPYISSISNLNISLITFILSKHNNKLFALDFLKELYQKFSSNNDVLKQYALTLDSLSKTNEAIRLMENNFEIINSDPSSLLYLAMFYLKSNQNENALKIFNFIEKDFHNYQEIVFKVRTIKEKLIRSVEV